MKYITLAYVLLLTSFDTKAGMVCDEEAIRAQSVQQIEYLRRWYAKATDSIGEATELSIREGRDIYHRIFSEKAAIKAGDGIPDQIGPEAWVEVVLGALGELGPTQHLIGTQLVTIDKLELDDSCDILVGSADMESYVQAWHERKDDRVWLFLGTYVDRVQYSREMGWQIHEMTLLRVGGETRYMGSAIGRSVPGTNE